MRLVLCVSNLEKAPGLLKTGPYRTGMHLCKSSLSTLVARESKSCKWRNHAAELAAMPCSQRLSHHYRRPTQTLLLFCASLTAKQKAEGTSLSVRRAASSYMCPLSAF